VLAEKERILREAREILHMIELTSEALPLRGVFEHAKRREWGLGIIAWERKNRRGYLFENGQLRILASEFYSLMREVDCPEDEVQALYDSLKRELKAAGVEGKFQPKGVRQIRPAMSFDDQLAVFRAEYSGGFEDPLWVQTQRGTGVKKRLAGHRDSAMTQARAKLAADDLDGRLAQQQFRSISDDVVAVLRRTDLVPPAELAVLEGADADRPRLLACAIRDLLHGNVSFGTRFDRFLSRFEQAYGQSPSWQLTTALPALLCPSEHIYVRPAVIREQSKWMAPRLSLPNQPTAASYMRSLSMVKLVLQKLTEQGESPRDLLDVFDFMRVTTGPTAKKLLLRTKPSASTR
jgi:hypothetical protein